MLNMRRGAGLGAAAAAAAAAAALAFSKRVVLKKKITQKQKRIISRGPSSFLYSS